MGKICPQCKYHFPDEPVYQHPPIFGCQHDYVREHQEETSSTQLPQTKWRCKKCLEVKYTND